MNKGIKIKMSIIKDRIQAGTSSDSDFTNSDL